MAQPVRKVIKEEHPELGNKIFYTLLVDGGNLLRMSFADTKVNTKGIHYGGVFQFLLQLKLMLKKKMYDYIYVFFDDSNSGILRYKIYDGYKANRGKNYGENESLSDYAKQVEATLAKWRAKRTTKVKEKSDAQKIVDENFDREREILMRYFDEMYIRCVFDDITEGDDLIAYYVQHKDPNERIVIMSTDEDLTQLISDTVCVYNKRLGKYISDKNFKDLKGFPIENVVLKKIFLGDTSDNIKNISGLSESKLFELMPEIRERKVSVDEVKERASAKINERIENKKKPLKWHENIVNGVGNGEYDGDFYEVNKKLIDLSEPLITDEAREMMDSMMYAVQDPEGRSFDNLYKMIVYDGIDELVDEKSFSNFFEIFKTFANNEIKRYKSNS